MDLLLYENEINYLIERINITMDHLESVVKLIQNRKNYQNFSETTFKEEIKKASKLSVNKLAIYSEVNKLRRDLRETKNIIRKIYHILGQELLTSGGISTVHLNEYYALEDVFVRLHLYSQNSENYSHKRVVFITIDILKRLTSIYNHILE